MTVAWLDFFYEGIYSARMLAGVSIVASQFLTVRRGAKWKMPLLYACIILFGASFSVLVDFITETYAWDYVYMAVLHVCWYTFLLIVCFGAMAACFKACVGEYIYVFTCGCLAECSVFGFFRLFIDFGVIELRVNTPFSILFEILFSVALYAVLYAVCRYRVKKYGRVVLQKKPFVTVYFLFTIAFIMFLRFSLQSVYETLYRQAGSWVISLVLGFIPLAQLVLAIGIIQVEKLSNDNVVLNSILAEKERQYAISTENVETINRKCHDLKRQLRALRFVGEDERNEAIEKIKGSIAIYDSQIKTGNAALNTLLSEKGLYCTSRNIKLTNMVDGDALAMISSIDIYVMFDNLLDNAIEAVEKIEDEEKRVISLTVNVQNGVVCIQTNNYFSGDVQLVDGVPQTTKGDKDYHGYGVKSLKHIVEKYGGVMNVCVQDDVFIVLMTIPVV